HHTVYIGVHVPKSYHRRRRHRRRSSHKEKKERLNEGVSDKSDTENVDDSATSILKPLISPAAERIRFILGEEESGPPPPQLFTELDELLTTDGNEVEWKETARWLKFEEKVEEGGERWSKPHVATLYLHSLFELKKCIEKGTVMLDMEANSLQQIVDMITDTQIEMGLLKAELKEKVTYTLLRKHRHQTKKSNLRSLADIGRTVSSASRLFSNQENGKAVLLLHKTTLSQNCALYALPTLSQNCALYALPTLSQNCALYALPTLSQNCALYALPTLSQNYALYALPTLSQNCALYALPTLSQNCALYALPTLSQNCALYALPTLSQNCALYALPTLSQNCALYALPTLSQNCALYALPTLSQNCALYALPTLSQNCALYALPTLSQNCALYALPTLSQNCALYALPTLSQNCALYALPTLSQNCALYALPTLSQNCALYALPTLSQNYALYALPTLSLNSLSFVILFPYLCLNTNGKWDSMEYCILCLIHKGTPTTAPHNLTSSSLIDLSDKPEKDQLNNKFMKKIPRDAEASNILVGEVDFLDSPFVAFVRLQQSVMLAGLTEVPVPTRFLFVLLGPKGKARSYHEIGRAIATLMSDEVFHDIAYKAKDRGDLLAGIEEFLDEVIVLPPGEWDPDIRIEPPKSLPSSDKRKNNLAGGAGGGDGSKLNGDAPIEGGAGGGGGGHHVGDELKFTGKFCGGLYLDVKRKLPFFASDFYDALNIQALSAILFIYLGTVTNAITFGGLLGDATDNMQGVIESFVGTALAGSVFCMLGGQPLTILSSTGPVLVFERLLFNFSKDHNLDYLEFRLWIGLWSGFLCLVLVATDASFLVQYFTRFTEEGFAALISFIFIYDAFKKMLKLAHHYPIDNGYHWDMVTQYACHCMPPEGNNSISNEKIKALFNSTGQQHWNSTWSSLTRSECLEWGGVLQGESCGFVPDITLMSFILFMGTYTCSMGLKKFKTSRFFPTMVRKLISDFAIILAILIFCGIDALVGVDTPKLEVPSEFKPTNPNRGWFVPPFGGNPWWVYLASFLPALLVTILIFMDQQITAVIVNRKENKLKKGAGYHLDLFLVAVLMIVCSFMGLPWYVAATVISIAHIDSLKMETETSAPGEQPKFLGVREQRVTGVSVFLLTGLSVFMAPVLKFIPMPVLYGVFLYMGVASLNGVQFMDRLKLFLMPAKHQPDLIYLRHVPLRRVHLFTFVQILCLALLWILKSTVAAIIFPVMILALVAVRKAMDYIFSQHDLGYLDDVMPEKDKKKKEDEKKKKKKKGSIDSDLNYSDYPGNDNIPSIKISMETMEEEKMRGEKPSEKDSHTVVTPVEISPCHSSLHTDSLSFFPSRSSQDLSPFKKSVPVNRADLDPKLNRFF
ncbi:hypothetical protein QTP86_029793, partial [Hemibagrus guttatus]